MANTYFSINPSAGTALAIKNALISKYSTGVTIHFDDASTIVFTCSALSNKVIKISTSSGLRFYYGDAWTSGATLTNQVQWAGYNGGNCTFIDLVLGDNTFMLCAFQTPFDAVLYLIGKLTNDKYAIFSACGSNSYTTYMSAMNTTDMVNILPIGFGGPFGSASGKLYKQPLILQRTDGKIEENSDGTIASFKDIYNCSHTIPKTLDLVGSNYLMSSGELYMSSARRFFTSMIAEF